MQNSLKIKAATPAFKLADPVFNADLMISTIATAENDGVNVLVFPELCSCGFTCGVLFNQEFFLEKCYEQTYRIIASTKGKDLLVVFGAPLVRESYNVAFAVQNGKILSITPKTNLSAAFSEADNFFPYEGEKRRKFSIYDQKVPFGQSAFSVTLANSPISVSVEIGTDDYCNYSADLSINIAAIPTRIGGESEVDGWFKNRSGACLFVNAGLYESTANGVFGGEKAFYVNGEKRACEPAFSEKDLTVELSFPVENKPCFDVDDEPAISKEPFIPSNEKEKENLAEFVLNAAGHALAARMERSRAKTAVIGVSGGLDSTIALLIVDRAFEILEKDKKDIIAITMPGFGTTGKTKNNSHVLMNEIGATVKEIDITPSVSQHFKDIGHSENDYSVAYENSQARMRTMILMDVANETGGLVVGTGDLSEIALGWSTYNGDHMSMYAVNCGLPKTLIRYLVEQISQKSTGERARVLKEVYEQEISPELLPPSKNGEIAQKTESLIGPYELHDFFLYYFAKEGRSPYEVMQWATVLFEEYSPEEIKKWATVFFRRFTTQQFKRSCSPDGAAIGQINLSPKVWKMPADLDPSVFLNDLEEL